MPLHKKRKAENSASHGWSSFPSLKKYIVNAHKTSKIYIKPKQKIENCVVVKCILRVYGHNSTSIK
jgi:hypothetical protein